MCRPLPARRPELRTQPYLLLKAAIISAPKTSGFRYLIIGNGAAGYTAAQAIRRQDPGGRITILTDEPYPFYSRPGLAYLLTGAIPVAQLIAHPPEDYSRQGLEFVHGHAARLAPEARQVQLSDGRCLGYDALLLATGARAVLPPTPGMELDGVVTFDTLDDTRRILKLARRARRAVVIGGGITALELAEGLAARGVETHYLLRKDRYWSNVLDPEESAIVEKGLVHEGVIVHKRTNIERVLEQRGRVAGILTEDGQQLKCQIVAVAIGVRPSLELPLSGGLKVDRGILVDEYMRTSERNIFAAGDVAQIFDPATQEYKMDSLWWMAQEHGSIAGSNMAGGASTYVRSIPFNVTRIGGIVTTIIGTVGQSNNDDDLVSIVHGDSESWRDRLDSFAIETGSRNSRLRLVVGENTLIGAVIMGDQTFSRPLQHLIQSQTDLGRFRDQLIRAPERSLELLFDYCRKMTPEYLASVA